MARNVLFVCLLVATFVVGCSGGTSGSSSAYAPPPSLDSTVPGSGNTTPPPTNYTMYPLTWESRVSGSQQWSNYLFNLILAQATYLMNGSTDVANFCSKYGSLTTDEKANFWAYLISEVALYESGDDPTNRYVETTMGTDPVTGQQVVSEGLLQLSYQDQLGYPFCQFDWSKDSQLSPTDPNKTILNPYINLNCGTLIMNQQIKNRGSIELSSGAYWSTLMTSSQYNKLAQIKAATQALPFCH